MYTALWLSSTITVCLWLQHHSTNILTYLLTYILHNHLWPTIQLSTLPFYLLFSKLAWLIWLQHKRFGANCSGHMLLTKIKSQSMSIIYKVERHSNERFWCHYNLSYHNLLLSDVFRCLTCNHIKLHWLDKTFLSQMLQLCKLAHSSHIISLWLKAWVRE